MNAASGTQKDDEQRRFLVELEFVQCLANPSYLQFLAQHGYFDKQEFVNYLQYLQYWRQPEYSQFITFPHCLFFLEMLTSADFCSHVREAMSLHILYIISFAVHVILVSVKACAAAGPKLHTRN